MTTPDIFATVGVLLLVGLGALIAYSLTGPPSPAELEQWRRERAARSWPNLAAFRAWAAEIDRLASETPDEPIPYALAGLVFEPPNEADLAWGREQVERWEDRS